MTTTLSPAVPRLLPLAALLADAEADAERRHEAYATGHPLGAVTALPSLDRTIGGHLAAGLHVLHAEPGTGKTALALQVAVSCGCPAVYVTSEMAPLELLKRITANLTGTYLGRLKSGELMPEAALQLYRRAIALAGELVMVDATQAPATADYLAEVIPMARRDADHLLLVVDSVNTWAAATLPAADEYVRLEGAVNGLHALAMAEQVAILGIAERNRGAIKTGGMSASKGTASFEYRATSVWDLSKGDGDGAVVPVKLTLPKNREGNAGVTLPLMFEGRLQRFTEAGQ